MTADLSHVNRSLSPASYVEMSNFIIVFLLFGIQLTLSVEKQNSKPDEGLGLYSKNDDVVVLTHGTFFRSVVGVNNAWIIEFYNSWCGHCIHFAPTWKLLATDVKAWNQVIRIGAVDCATKENLELCSHYDIKGYPTMKFFLPFSTKKDMGESYNQQNQTTIRNKMVDFVSDIMGHSEWSWPNLQPLRSVDKIWEDARKEHKHVVLIFEDEKSYLGREVILDMSQHKDILIRRALRPMMIKFGITRFPSMFLLHSDGRYERLSPTINNREAYVLALNEVIDGGATLMDKVKGGNIIPSQTTESDNNLYFPKKHQVYMQDLESTLTYLLRHEVAIHREIDFKSLESLKKFLQVLAMYFPGREEVSGFLWRIHTFLSGTTVTTALSGLHWLHSIDSLQSVDTFLPDTVKWVCCQGSQRQYRGYPCGMWTLFHTLTVNSYHIEKSNPKHAPQEVLKAIASYMRNFFGCVQCREHFEKMAVKIKTDVKTKEDAVLWLWRAHNEANKRLKGDTSEDPVYPKVQFPPKDMCPKCHKKSSSPENPDWDETAVLIFLLKYYSKNNIVGITDDDESFINKDFNIEDLSRDQLDWWERKQRRKDIEKIWVLRENKKKSRAAKKSHSQSLDDTDYSVNEKLRKQSVRTTWGFNSIDIGMCMVFYVLCALIVLYMYYHFTIKRRRNSCRILPS